LGGLSRGAALPVLKKKGALEEEREETFSRGRGDRPDKESLAQLAQGKKKQTRPQEKKILHVHLKAQRKKGGDCIQGRGGEEVFPSSRRGESSERKKNGHLGTIFFGSGKGSPSWDRLEERRKWMPKKKGKRPITPGNFYIPKRVRKEGSDRRNRNSSQKKKAALVLRENMRPKGGL